jgi:ABC-type glycerol-3-phosphate transport system substrate-binding protein
MRKGWILAIVLLLAARVTAAQTPATVLKLVLPYWMFDDGNSGTYFDDFKAAHPSVELQVQSENYDGLYIDSPIRGVTKHLDAVENYVSKADVLYVSPFSIMPESTRTGYWLDLKPFAQADPHLDPDRFLPTTWETFQWDGGQWALPVTADIWTMVYDPAAFDRAGLPYPTANWTIEDYARAARALTQRNSEGKVTVPGLSELSFLYRTFVGRNLWDASSGKLEPRLNEPDFVNLLTTWIPVMNDIQVQGKQNADASLSIPLRVDVLYRYPPSSQQNLRVALLPGGVAFASTSGVGVSAGTQNPQLAFELAKYIALHPRSSDSLPALMGQPLGKEIHPLSPDNQKVFDEGMKHLIGNADARYFDYIYTAMNDVASGKSVETALDNLQKAEVQNLKEAEARAGTNTVTVSTPIPTAAMNADETVLHFGFSNPVLPNEAQWERVASEFATGDPQIGQVVIGLNTANGDFDTFLKANDCYYLTNPVNSGTPEDALPLDAFINADPAFQPDDFLPGALEAMRFNGKTWGYPLTLQPSALMVDVSAFRRAGLPLPDENWTVEQFTDTLAALKAKEPDLSLAPFGIRQVGHQDVLALIAAFGGIPLDSRTNPMTFALNKPENRAAIRSVLDLAKAGSIRYSRLGQFNYTGSIDAGAAIYPREITEGFKPDAGYKLVNYPAGAYQPVVLDTVGALYISRNAPDPEACYRWIATLARHPELLSSMPARASALEDPAVTAAQGENVVAFYKAVAAQQQSRNAVVFGWNLNTEVWFPMVMMSKAFDAYVLDGADLDTVLDDAQKHIDTYSTCAADAPASDTAESETARYQYLISCFSKASPELYAEYAELAKGK